MPNLTTRPIRNAIVAITVLAGFLAPTAAAAKPAPNADPAAGPESPAKSGSPESLEPKLEIISVKPDPANNLQPGERFYVTVRYDMGDCASVQIWVRPDGSNPRSSSYSHGCRELPASAGRTGTLTGWFYYKEPTQVETIRVEMRDCTSNTYVKTIRHKVKAVWKAPESAQKSAPANARTGLTQIRGTFNWDIESDTQGRSPAADVWWEQVSATQRYLKLSNGALFADTGNTPYEQITADDLGKCTFAPNKLDGSNENPVLKPGFTFGLRTAEGNLAKCRVKAIHPGRQLELEWTLYEGMTAPSRQEPPKTQTSIAPDAKLLRRYAGTWRHTVTSDSGDKTLVLRGVVDQTGKLKFEFLKQHFSYLPVFQECRADKDRLEVDFKLVRYCDAVESTHTIKYVLSRTNKNLRGQFLPSWEKPVKVTLKPMNAAAAVETLSNQAEEINRLKKLNAESHLAHQRQTVQRDNRIKSLENELAQSQMQANRLRKHLDEIQRLMRQAKEKTDVLMDEVLTSLQRAKE